MIVIKESRVIGLLALALGVSTSSAFLPSTSSAFLPSTSSSVSWDPISRRRPSEAPFHTPWRGATPFIVQSTAQDLTTLRPAWLAELMVVKENKVLRLSNELRRIDWEEEDDSLVDELLMAGKVDEARSHFEKKKEISVPMYRQTLRYHWTQTETAVYVGVPVPKAVRGSSMHLIVAEDALQMALVDEPSFGVISGKFAGMVDPATSGWQLVQKPDGSYSVSMTLKKLSQPGTHSLWYQLLQGETLGPYIQFKGKTERYHWRQDLDYMNAFFPIVEGIRGKAVELTIDAGGKGISLTYPREAGNSEDRVIIEDQFCGVVAPDECSWVIDEDEGGVRSICLSLRKRRRDATESTWWSRFLRAEEEVIPPEMTQIPVDQAMALQDLDEATTVSASAASE